MSYKVRFEQCPHCREILDGPELEEHIEAQKRALQASKSLGLGFLVMALFIVVLMVLAL